MKELLVNIKPIKDKVDEWIWCLETLRQFSVKSCYMWLFGNFAGVGAMEEEEEVQYVKLRRSDVLSKEIMHTWRLLLNKLATRDTLLKSGMISAACDT